MMSPYFESLVKHSLTILAEEPDDSTAMVWSEAEASAAHESSDKAIYKLDLNDKEVLVEEIGDLLSYDGIRKVKELWLDKNEFGNEGVELLANSSQLKKLLVLSLAHNKLTNFSAQSIAASSSLTQLQKLFLQSNQIGLEGLKGSVSFIGL